MLIPPPSHLIIDHCMCLLKFVLILGVFFNGAALQQKWPLPSSVLCTVNRRKSGNACSYALQCCAVNCSGRGKRSAGRLTCSRRRSRSFRRKVECQYFFFFWSHTRLEIRGEQAWISLCLGLRASVSCIDFCTNNTTTVYHTYIKEPYYDRFQI